MNKRDKQGVRHPAELERKYSFGKVFANQANENARQNSEMDQQRMTMQQFISYASSTLDTLKKDLDAAEVLIATLQTAVSRLVGRMDTAEGHITNHGTRLTTAEGNITNLGNRMTSAVGNITGQGTRLTTAENNISNHSTRLTTAEIDIKELADRVTALEKT